MDLIRVPAGALVMGRDDGPPDERPAHRHPIERPFWIAVRPVCQAQLRVYTRATGAAFPAQGWLRRRADLPATRVTWDEARAFCAWAGLALPTEAEWEKAARGAHGARVEVGDDDEPAPPSPWGAERMSDGVLEWCEDAYDARAYLRQALGLSAPASWTTGAPRVARGRDWSRESPSPATARAAFAPDTRDTELGFRPVLRDGAPT